MSNSSSPFSNFSNFSQASQEDLTLGGLFAQYPVFEAVFKQAHAHPPEPTGVKIEVEVLAHTLPALSEKDLTNARNLISSIRAALHKNQFDRVKKFSDQLLKSRAIEHLCQPYKIEGTDEIVLEYPEIIQKFISYLEDCLDPETNPDQKLDSKGGLFDQLQRIRFKIDHLARGIEKIFLDQDLKSIPNPFTPFPSLSSSPEPEPLAGAGSGAGSDSMSNSPNSQPLSMTNSRCATPMLESSGRPRSEGFSCYLKGLSPLGAH